jgi:hypothetical protein
VHSWQNGAVHLQCAQCTMRRTKTPAPAHEPAPAALRVLADTLPGDAAHTVRAAADLLHTALHVWTELSVLVGCSSPDGSAELGQVELHIERARDADATRHRCDAYAARLRAALDEPLADIAQAVTDMRTTLQVDSR